MPPRAPHNLTPGTGGDPLPADAPNGRLVTEWYFNWGDGTFDTSAGSTSGLTVTRTFMAAVDPTVQYFGVTQTSTGRFRGDRSLQAG